MYLISVIIPVYNAEYFIDECFYSVLNKNNSIEIILIDDCSTDNTKKKLIEYTKKYNNIKTIFHKSNLGVSETRNSGINIATGKYIILCFDSPFVIFHQQCYTIRRFFQI